jgi:class 3 adenylate cyclase
MSWNHDTSLERIQKHLADLGERGIHVTKLSRQSDDLEQLLSETECRQIYGAHVYGEATNFADLSSTITQTNDYKKFLRSAHIYQSEVARIIEQIFNAYFVHFQGPRFHALIYRPIDDVKTIAKKTVLLELATRDWIATVFNPFGQFDQPYVLACGADVGDVIGTRDGPRGGQELLFLGPAANNSAKMLATSSALIAKTIFDALPDDYKKVCTRVATSDIYAVGCSKEQLDSLMATEGLTWDRDALRKRLEDLEAGIPLASIDYSGTDDPIDFSSLSIRNNKRVTAATVYADVDGFTAYVAAQTTEAQQEMALRVFHAIRRESGRIGSTDYDGVKVQFQGDRIQLIINVPKDDEAAIALNALDIAMALNAAMETTLREALGSEMTVHYAIGIDMGTTLATRFGQRGDRDNICLGSAVANAAVLQEVLAKSKHIVTSSKVYALLPKSYAKFFERIPGREAYVAKGLMLLDLEKVRAAEKFATIGVVAGLGLAAAGVVAAAAASRKPEPPPPPPQSWSP